MINRVVLVGRLTRDVEVRQTPSNLSVATFTVACDRRQSAASRQQGEQKQADFITCVAWRQTADFLGRYAKKGALVGVEGRIQTRNYDDPKEPGRKVYVTEVQCDNVQLLESKSASAGRTSSDYSMAHTVRDLLQRSGNVIICCHREADFDCMGSAIAFARMAQTLHREAVIIARTGGIEEKLAACMSRYKDELKEEVRLVTENEALNQLRNDTLVVMVDHHSANQSNGAQVLEKAKHVIIIDHHRRGADMGVMPELVYIEAGASSTSELITEMIPYVSSQIELSELDATIMLTGMTIDTNRFRVRTGARTYDAASTLRKWGADPLLADELLKDSYGEFAEKTAVMNINRDKITSVDQVLSEGEQLCVTYFNSPIDIIVNKESMKKELIYPETVYEENAELQKGKTELKQAGANGAKNSLYSEKWVNGVLVSGSLVSSVDTEQPQNEIISVGTMHVRPR